MNSQAPTPAGHPLVSAAELAQAGAAVVIIDCRHDLADPQAGRRAYAAGHIPGAHFLHLDDDLSGPLTGRNGRHPLPDPAAFAARLGAVGVSEHSTVVAYDDSGGMYAARLWWMLGWIGHDAAHVLDGGWTAWCAAGLPRSSTPGQPQARPGPAVRLRPERAVDAAFVLRHLGTPACLVVDARGADRFRGENETLDPVGGHIPGARNRPFRDNLLPDGRFKPAAQLAAEWAAVLDGAPPHALVHQCGSGVTACHNLLAMRLAGIDGTRLYPGSWSEWCSDPARPVARG